MPIAGARVAHSLEPWDGNVLQEIAVCSRGSRSSDREIISLRRWGWGRRSSRLILAGDRNEIPRTANACQELPVRQPGAGTTPLPLLSLFSHPVPMQPVLFLSNDGVMLDCWTALPSSSRGEHDH